MEEWKMKERKTSIYQRKARNEPFAHDSSVAIAPLSLLGAYNMVYLARLRSSKFLPIGKNFRYTRTLDEMPKPALKSKFFKHKNITLKRELQK
jgi:hypothetical protein